MTDTKQPIPKPQRKGFLQRLIEKFDKKLEEKSKQTPCCGTDKDDSGSSCCN